MKFWWCFLWRSFQFGFRLQRWSWWKWLVTFMFRYGYCVNHQQFAMFRVFEGFFFEIYLLLLHRDEVILVANYLDFANNSPWLLCCNNIHFHWHPSVPPNHRRA